MAPAESVVPSPLSWRHEFISAVSYDGGVSCVTLMVMDQTIHYPLTFIRVLSYTVSTVSSCLDQALMDKIDKFDKI